LNKPNLPNLVVIPASRAEEALEIAAGIAVVERKGVKPGGQAAALPQSDPVI
jgi:sulfopyruvate decarboxylase TPP-binding subunit